MSTLNINVAEMVKRGMSAEDIQATIAAEIKAAQEKEVKVAANPDVVAIGEKLVAGGTPTIAELVLLVIETAKAEMPTLKILLEDEDISLEELKGLEVELKPLIGMYDSIIKMSLDMGMTKEDLLKSGESKSGNISGDQLTAILRGLSR